MSENSKATITIEDVDLLTKKVNIDINKDIVIAKEEEVYGMMCHEVQVPGFRKGKTPLAIIKQRFAKNIEGEIINALVPETVDDMLKEYSFSPVNTPKIDNVAYKPSRSLTLDAAFEIYPDIDTVGYRDADIDLPLKEVTDEAVEELLVKIIEGNKKLVNKEGDDLLVADGDYLKVDLKTFHKGEEVTDILTVAEGYSLNVGSKGFVPDIEEALVGAKIGDMVSREVSFPDSYRTKMYAGENITIEATVKEIQVELLPEADDAFAKTILDREDATIDELKNRIREELPARFEEERADELKNNLKRVLVEKNSIEIPPTLLKKEIDREMFNEHMALVRAGRDWDMLMRDPLKLSDDTKKKAEDAAAYFILINKIVEKEDIYPPDEDVRSEIVSYGIRKGAPFENGMPKISESEMFQVHFNMLEDAVISLIMKQEESAEKSNEEDGEEMIIDAEVE